VNEQLTLFSPSADRSRDTKRRRRLLNACRWHSRSVDIREYVRAIERFLDQVAIPVPVPKKERGPTL
jgi:hypothetical protein